MSAMPPVEEWPRIIFGTSTLGNLYAAIEESTKRAIIAEWFRHQSKPVFVDSAGKYGAGLALESMANHLRALEVDPDSIVISNKLGWKRIPLTTKEPTFEPGAWIGIENDATQSISYDGIMECFAQGNELLGDYRAQMLSVHDPDEYLEGAATADEKAERLEHIKEAYKALAELKEAGRAQAIGVGAKDWRTIQMLHGEGISFDWVMIANSYTIMRHPPALREFMGQLQREGIAVINSAVYHGGFVTGGDFFNYQKVTEESDPDLFSWRKRFHALCHEFEIEPARAACQFAIAPEAVQSIAVSTSRPERVQSLVELTSREVPAAFREALKEERLIEVTW
ncbi:MAG: aldo/keto reductase [Verrucomicrobiales bacterium]|nr:aldo/keto reductase [Verrucomicrobiales bacterium]